MEVNASHLRKDVYRLLDRVIKTGQPLEIVRNGCRLKIVPTAKPGRKLDRLVAHDCLRGDPDDLVHLDWSDEWTGGDPK